MLILCGIYMQTFMACALLRPQEVSIDDYEELIKSVTEDKTSPVMARKHTMATASLLSLTSIASGDRSKWLSQSGMARVKQSTPVNRSLAELRQSEYMYGSKDRQIYQLQSHSHNDISVSGAVAKEKNLSSTKTDKETDSNQSETLSPKSAATKPHYNGIAKMGHKPPRNNLWTLLSNKYIMVLNCNIFFVHASFCIVFVHFVNYFYSEGMSQSELSMLMTVIGSCSIVCRLLVGAVTNNDQISVLLICIAGGGITGIFILMCPILAQSTAGRVIFAIGIGFYGNIYNALMGPLLLTVCALEDLSLAYGIELFVCGITGLFAPPFAGEQIRQMVEIKFLLRETDMIFEHG